MNEPLRYDQYTLYQTGWDQDRSRKIYYSSFSVVRNPSDKVPLISCIIIGIGLVIHFGRKLYLHLKAQARRQANLGSAA